MSIKLFTHVDLDGVGCAVLAKHTFGKDVDVSYCNYSDVNEIVAEFITSGDINNYQLIYITDISLNKETADALEEAHENGNFVVQLLDHHKSALWMNERYQWAYVETHIEESEKGSSGTSMLYDDLLLNVLTDEEEERVKLLFDFQEEVRRYDTWEWKTVYEDEFPNDLNLLLDIQGRDLFIATMLDRIEKAPMIVFTEKEGQLMDFVKAERQKYFEEKLAQVQLAQVEGYTLGVVYAEQHRSNLGNYILDNIKEEIDLVAMINLPQRTVSYRAKDNKSAGEFAALHPGGGGHPNAAGSQIDPALSASLLAQVIGGGIA